MPRYYFHLINRHEEISDRDGIDMREQDEAQITKILDEIRSDEPELFDVDENWSIEVVDQKGRRVASFLLRP